MAGATVQSRFLHGEFPYVPKQLIRVGASRRVIQKKSPTGTKNPKQLQTNIQTSHTFRFYCNDGGANINISNADLLDLMCFATGATTAYRVLDGIKLSHVEAWSANGSGAVSNTIQIEWLPTNYAGDSGKVVTDTAIGVTDIAHVFTRVPKLSGASFWVSGNPSTSINFFSMTLPPGSVVDVHCTISMKENDIAAAVLGSVSGATAGTFYYRYLDSNGSKLLAPLGAYAI